MTKQFSRNPLIAGLALSQGLDSTVSVDIHCAKLLHRHGLPIGHVGHLNQIPMHDTAAVLAMAPDAVTVYSVEAAERVNAAAAAVGRTQDLLLRVWRPGDVFFEGQEGGFREDLLLPAARRIAALPNVRIAGVTSFPCLAYGFGGDGQEARFNPNMMTITENAARLRQELGLELPIVNAPGNTSARLMVLLAEGGATHVEPGHGLCGTTPTQIVEGDHPEIPAYVYVSEISHHHEGLAYAFAGGIWSLQAGFLPPDWPVRACVGRDPEQAAENVLDYVHIPQIIDYHVPLTPGERARIGDTIVLPIYTQSQMTRGHIAPVSGIANGDLQVWGLFDHNATMLDADYNPVPTPEVKRIMAEVVGYYAA